MAEVAQAVKWEMIGQTFAVFGITMAKISLGLMLLRFSMKRWHKIVIWVSMGLLLSASILVDISFWIQCRPVQAIYDPRLRPNAVCDVDETPFATTLTGEFRAAPRLIFHDGNTICDRITSTDRLYSLVTCVTADFFFAIFPAVVIWPLNMKKKEKITLIASLGLGVL